MIFCVRRKQSDWDDFDDDVSDILREIQIEPSAVCAENRTLGGVLDDGGGGAAAAVVQAENRISMGQQQ